jgi:hypothetical protein
MIRKCLVLLVLVMLPPLASAQCYSRYSFQQPLVFQSSFSVQEFRVVELPRVEVFREFRVREFEPLVFERRFEPQFERRFVERRREVIIQRERFRTRSVYGY